MTMSRQSILLDEILHCFSLMMLSNIFIISICQLNFIILFFLKLGSTIFEKVIHAYYRK